MHYIFPSVKTDKSYCNASIFRDIKLLFFYKTIVYYIILLFISIAYDVRRLDYRLPVAAPAQGYVSGMLTMQRGFANISFIKR